MGHVCARESAYLTGVLWALEGEFNAAGAVVRGGALVGWRCRLACTSGYKGRGASVRAKTREQQTHQLGSIDCSPLSMVVTVWKYGTLFFLPHDFYYLFFTV